MNARWFRDNLMVVIFSVAFLGILGTSIWFLHQASLHAAVVQGELETQRAELERLTHQPQFPSADNIKILKRDRETVAKLYDDILTNAIRAPLETKTIDRGIDFSQWMRSTVESLSREASNQNVRLPEAFAFGFTRYIASFPCQNPSLGDAECRKLLALLSKQLTLVQYLTKIMIDSHVDDILAIRRVEVEGGASSVDALAIPANAPQNPLYQTYPFEVAFTTDTDGLRNFLNNISKADCLFVIRSVNIVGTVSHVTVKSEETPDGTNQIDGIITPKKQETKTVDVRRLNVTVRLDLVEFTPSKPVSAKK